MLACSLSPCRMYTRNTSLAEKAWKVRREVFMLLFTKTKTKKKITITFKRLAGHIQKSTCWIFFPTYKFGINGLLPKSYFVLHAIKNGCVYASYRVEEYVHFLKFLKCHLWEVEEERLIWHGSVVKGTQYQLGIRMLSGLISNQNWLNLLIKL